MLRLSTRLPDAEVHFVQQNSRLQLQSSYGSSIVFIDLLNSILPTPGILGTLVSCNFRAGNYVDFMSEGCAVREQVMFDLITAP